MKVLSYPAGNGNLVPKYGFGTIVQVLPTRVRLLGLFFFVNLFMYVSKFLKILYTNLTIID